MKRALPIQLPDGRRKRFDMPVLNTSVGALANFCFLSKLNSSYSVKITKSQWGSAMTILALGDEPYTLSQREVRDRMYVKHTIAYDILQEFTGSSSIIHSIP